MSRTKQTARKSTGAKAPLRQLAPRRPPRSPAPETLNIAHQNPYALLRAETPFDGSGSEVIEESSEESDTPVVSIRKRPHCYRQKSQSGGDDREDQETDGDQEASAGRQQRDGESQISQPATVGNNDEEEEEISNISTLTDSAQDNHGTCQEAGAASILSDASQQPSGRRDKPGNQTSRSKMKQILASLADGPSGKAYSQAIPIHGLQLSPREGDLNVMSDPDLSQERLKRTRSYEDDDEEEFERSQYDTSYQTEVSPAQSARPTARKKNKRSTSVPAIESPGNLAGDPHAIRLPPTVKMASADDKMDKVTEEDSVPSNVVKKQASTENTEGAVRQTTKSTDPQQSSTACNAQERKTSSIIDFETLPGPPIEPFDTERLSADYETLADEHDVKMKAIMEEWQKLNEKIETWILRGTQVQAVREGCILLHNVQQVNEKVQEATKQREDLVKFCKHMQTAFSMFFPDP